MVEGVLDKANSNLVLEATRVLLLMHMSCAVVRKVVVRMSSGNVKEMVKPSVIPVNQLAYLSEEGINMSKERDLTFHLEFICEMLEPQISRISRSRDCL